MAWRPPERSAIPLPFAAQVTGDWRAAAALWERMGCPYEQALALADGDEAGPRAALGIFEWGRLPCGPRPITWANPQGLTPRQLEILLLLAEGLHNAEIADRLSTTPKTVDHHVSAVLANLEARSRTEAVRVAYEAGFLPHTAPSATANMGGRSL